LGDRVPLILDGGPCRHGLESSVVLVNQSGPPVLLRPGAITREAIEAVAGCRLAAAGADADAPVSPGRLASHYAPTTPLRLEARSVDADEALLAFGTPLPHAGPMRNLSASGDLIEAAANLFSALRELDRSGARAIAVMPVPRTGLGEAINDRLRRAAH
jgi:L-threonylcarbamoyladenylate synthase